MQVFSPLPLRYCRLWESGSGDRKVLAALCDFHRELITHSDYTTGAARRKLGRESAHRKTQTFVGDGNTRHPAEER